MDLVGSSALKKYPGEMPDFVLEVAGKTGEEAKKERVLQIKPFVSPKTPVEGLPPLTGRARKVEVPPLDTLGELVAGFTGAHLADFPRKCPPAPKAGFREFFNWATEEWNFEPVYRDRNSRGKSMRAGEGEDFEPRKKTLPPKDREAGGGSGVGK